MSPTTTRPTMFLTTLLMLISTVFAEGEKIIGNQTMIDGPLFDTYQFLSPGIMMGFVVMLILLLLLYIGVSALSSLEVTYAAFEKESGPGSKKQQ